MTAVPVAAPPDDAHPDAEVGVSVALTVAFTDLEDFTTYTQAHGDDAARRLLIGHQRQASAIVAAHGGRVLKLLGDGLLLTFATPQAAVLACLELAETAPLPLRAGIHTGTVLTTDNDVIGHVVNLAARLTASADGGQLVVTDHVHTAVGNLPHVTFDGPHPRTFKGINQNVPVYLTSRHAGRRADPQTEPAGRRVFDGGSE